MSTEMVLGDQAAFAGDLAGLAHGTSELRELIDDERYPLLAGYEIAVLRPVPDADVDHVSASKLVTSSGSGGWGGGFVQ